MDINQEYEVVPVDSICEHPDNPNVGDESVIDESLEANGWFGAVIVQKSTRLILAGNHRYRVAKRKGAKEIPVIFRDVDDETAKRILLVDNAAADKSHYDEEQLRGLLDSLESLEGTGFDLSALEEAGSGDEASEEASPGLPDPDDIPDDRYTPDYGIMLVCESEEDQAELYEWLRQNLPTERKMRVVAV